MSDSTLRGVLRTIEREYVETLREYLSGAGEAALAGAYDLGRRAVLMHVSLLDLAAVHQSAARALSERGLETPLSLTEQFFTEALSPYELTLRAYHDHAKHLGLGHALAQKNEELDRSRSQLQTILNATTALIYLRGTDRAFFFTNRRFAEVLGVEPERLVGSRGDALLPEAIDRVLLEGDERALRAGVPQEGEETLLLADGEHTFLALRFPLLDEHRAPYAVCCVATDISERKRASEAIRVAKERADQANRDLRAAQAQLVQSAKMASLGQLVAGIAHEINNPLSFVLSHLRTIDKILKQVEEAVAPRLDPPLRADWDRVNSRVREMEGGLERIRDLVQKLRTFSRIDEGEFKLASMTECIDSVLTILRHRLEGRIQVELRLGPPDLVECYPRLLNQALLNLVSNAIEAIEGEGTISIDGRELDGCYCVEVRDDGQGIADAHRERIWEPFFTTKPVGQGMGLGLSITYSIVQQHGGSLDVASAPGQGTVVTIRLPLERRAPEAP